MELVELVLLELGEHLEAADRLVPGYAREYAASSAGLRRRVRPPAGLHPQVAAMVRDVTLDALALERVAVRA